MTNTLLWLPLAAGLLASFVPAKRSGWVASAGTLATLGIAIWLVIDFQTGSSALQHAVNESWIPTLGVRYELGIDGISLFLILLTAAMWFGSTLFTTLRGVERARTYYLMLGIAETATLGAFMAQDLLLFVLFFDAMLIPFYFLIGGWGKENEGVQPIAATIKMIVYTLVGSLLMLVAAVATAVLAADGGDITFSLATLQQHTLSTGSQYWIFCFFALAFLVKMPAFVLHGWMPDAYRTAPLPVLVLLSGVLSKVGAYGFLRIVLPLFPDATVHFQELILAIALAGILYGSIMAFTQTNVRLIAGYSSVAQLGFITLGIFSLRAEGSEGAVLQMVNHGLVVGTVFLVIAVLSARTGTEDIREMGGMALRAPVLATLFLVVTMATLAIPGSANFIGEFYILIGTFQSKIGFALVATLGIAFAAFYALRLFQRTMHNPLPAGKESREITWREGAIVAPLVACIVALALYPQVILERSDATISSEISFAYGCEGKSVTINGTDDQASVTKP